MKQSNSTAIRCVLLVIIILSVTQVFSADPQDVVINEIAWMGTAVSGNHEWIELYNQTNSDIDLAGWTLSALDGTPDIQLEGTIPAQGYFLLERSDDSTISIAADQVYTGALGNTGECLQVKDDLAQVIDQVDCSTEWFGGDNTTKSSMERKHPSANGDVAENWGANDGVTCSGEDQNGASLCGTPKSQNSVFDITLSVSSKDLLPSDYFLLTNFPNPFNPETVIRYRAQSNHFGIHKLAIYNLKGEMVREFTIQSTGAREYEIVWDGRDEFGKDVSSGLYFCRLASSENVLKSIRMLKIK